MKLLREVLGYILGGLTFVVLMPVLMWFVSGMPAFVFKGIRVFFACLMMFGGLALSVWTIVYMRLCGKGNPMDVFGHEVAPRTQNLMTGGPYRLNRNPMLSGTILYLSGVAIWLWSWQALLVLAVFIIVMIVQVFSEEQRLRRDFGEEYDAYCRRTRRF